MTKRRRTILFLICLSLFLLAAPSMVFYSQGYRFDFEKKKLTQTGGLFLKIIPKQAEVYINDKLIKKTDFFFGSALIENLLPRKYKIEVKKEGYLPWKKNLEIKEKQVTEAKNIILFPKDPNFKILTQGVENFWFSPDEKKVILYETNEEGWILKLYDLERNVKSQLIGEKDIYQKGADLMNLEFSEDLKEIYLDIEMKEQIKYFSLDLSKSPPTLKEREEPIPPIEKALAYKKFNNDIYYLDNSGYLFKNREKLIEEPFPVKTETKYELDIFPEYTFLLENETLYLFNPDLKIFENFFENLNSLKISPDLKKLIYFSDYEIWVLFLIDSQLHQKGERVFLTRLSEKIENVFWLNSDYFIFNSGDKIKIAEIDDRDRIQIWETAQIEASQIYFNQRDKKLYLLKDENLYFSEPLLK